MDAYFLILEVIINPCTCFLFFLGPAGFRTPTVVGIGPRYIDVMWKKPLVANGVLTEYKVYQNGQYRESVSQVIT